ncbi:MAG: hypothetical protein WD871_16250 [Xanthobacteraceae bacterium]
MAQKKKDDDRRSGRARARGGLRAFRKDDVRAQIERRLWALVLGAEQPKAGGTEPRLEPRLARALRGERRAARGGGPGYDPVRHLVLAGLERLMRRKRR